MRAPHQPADAGKIKILTAQDVARKLSFSVQTIYNLRCGGFMPPALPLPGRKLSVLRWLESDIDEWICQLARKDQQRKKKKQAMGGRPSKMETMAAKAAGFSSVSEYRKAQQAGEVSHG